MTSVALESAAPEIDRWQFAWQWSPSLVGMLAVVAVVVAVASLQRRRVCEMSLIAMVARIVTIVLLVVMLSGWSVVPKGLPDASMDRFVPSLAVRTPRIVRVGDSVGIDVEARLSAGEAGERTATADLVDADGATVASAPLVEKASVAIDGRSGMARLGSRLQGRIIWRPASAGAFSGSVRIRGGSATAADSVSIQAVSIQVVADPLRVLILDRPRFESRFLSRSLSRDERFAVTEVSLGADGPARTAAKLPATREAWSRFDAVVLGAIDALAIPEPAAAALVDAAANDGVGIVWSLDASSDPEAIAVSPLGRLLPFRGVSRRPPFTSRCGVRLEGAGEEAAWLAVADDAAVSREAWRAMPSVYAPVRPTVVRPTARVMATCTSVEAADGAVGPTSPFILVDQAGDSRIVAFLAETWRLRQGARGPFVERLLAQATLHAGEPHLASRVLAGAPTVPEPNPAVAESKGDAAGGTTIPRRPADIVPPTARPLWNHPAILALLLAACGTEWWIRERLGDGP